MGKALVLKAEVREHTGSKHAVKVRGDGRIPAIVYGHKQEPVAISVPFGNVVVNLSDRSLADSASQS